MDPSSLVLHALRLKGVADARAVSRSSGLGLEEVETVLGGATARQLVVERRGAVPGWALTEAGRDAHARAVAAEVIGTGCRRALAAAYAEFLALNEELLETCTAWQLRDGVANDHLDPDHDDRCVARLGRVDRMVQPICDRLSGALARLGGYGERLRAAREQVESGRRDWFTRPVIDSYHTVWFELHEDILVTLGLERGGEASRV